MTVDAAGRRRRRRGLAIGAAVLGVLAVTGGILVAQQSAAADPVLTAAAERRDVIRSVSGTGTLVDEVTYAIAADGTATVAATAGSTAEQGGAAQSSGRTAVVRSIDVEPGRSVRRDQRVARVDGPDGGEQDVESPVAGHVREITAAADATATELLTIGAGRVLAALTISENRIAQVRADQPVALTLAAGTASTTGVVDRIEQVPDDGSGALRYTVLVRLDHVPSEARIGMSATGAITTARADDVVAVPAAAIEVHGDAVRVRVERGDMTTTVPVRLGLVGDDAVEVTDGLRAGQRVVVGADGEVAATTSRLGPPSSVTGATPSAAPSGTVR